MTTDTLVRKFHSLAGIGSETDMDADSLIGVFQTFRPDGAALEGFFADLEIGTELQARLEQLYAAAGDDRRPRGGRDAYFVVRNPPPIEPDYAHRLATRWVEGVRELAASVGDAETAQTLDPTPRVRVLEGIPPKHPRDPAEKSGLLVTLQQDVPSLVERLDAGIYPPLLRPAYYFTACDTMLRDYLMWPFYASASGLDDPFAPYFQLWRRGVKYRVFGETQVDLYVPHQHR